tara:strand:+ start:278 stop:622 length:345 start_codon:yes stop_codon:yes gene_type:complete
MTFFLNKGKNITVSKSETTLTTLEVDSDQFNEFVITSQNSSLTIAAPTGSPIQGQRLILIITDDGTSRSLTFNSIFREVNSSLVLPGATDASKTHYLGFKYNETTSTWDFIAKI